MQTEWGLPYLFTRELKNENVQEPLNVFKLKESFCQMSDNRLLSSSNRYEDIEVIVSFFFNTANS
jgi:hypothetical protein